MALIFLLLLLYRGMGLGLKSSRACSTEGLGCSSWALEASQLLGVHYVPCLIFHFAFHHRVQGRVVTSRSADNPVFSNRIAFPLQWRGEGSISSRGFHATVGAVDFV